MAEDKKEREFLDHWEIWQSFYDLEKQAGEFGGQLEKAISMDETLYIKKVCGKYRRYGIAKNIGSSEEIGMTTICETEGDKNSREWSLCRFAPLLPGYPNIIYPKEVIPGEEETYGYIKASAEKGEGQDIVYYENFFERDRQKYESLLVPEKAKTSIVPVKTEIAALGFNIEKNDRPPLKISTGGMYEVALRDFLKDNPGKTKEDFPYVEVMTNKMTMIFPTSCEDLFEFAANIDEAIETEAFGKKAYRMKVSFFPSGDKPLTAYLYAGENALGGYVPAAGDNITGMLQFYGNLCPEGKKE